MTFLPVRESKKAAVRSILMATLFRENVLVRKTVEKSGREMH